MYTRYMTLLFFLYAGILTCAIWTVILQNKNKKNSHPYHVPFTTIIIALVLTVFGIMQAFSPLLQTLLERNMVLIFSGQWWRLFTSLLVQDGGLAGTIFNIIALLIIGSLAEQSWKRFEWLVIFLIGGILTNCLALFWQPIGAGNSIANFSLAGSLFMLSFFVHKQKFSQIISILGVILALVLLCMHDIHGIAVFIGMIIGLLLSWKTRPIVKSP